QSFDGGRIDAARPDGLTVRSHPSESEVRVCEAVAPCLRSRCLAANDRDVVVEADVASCVVLREQHALARKRFGKIRRFRIGTERDVVPSVFEDDDEDVIDAAGVNGMTGSGHYRIGEDGEKSYQGNY